MNGDVAGRLRDALEAADYTYDGVAAALGPEAHAALSRNETVPGLRRTGGGSPVETLTRLFLLQHPVPLAAAEAALPGLVDALCAEGLLERSVGEVAARLDCRPYSEDDTDLWVVSDLTPGPRRRPQPGRRRPRPRHQLRVVVAGPAHHPRAGRPVAGPRHRLRRPGAAPGRAQPRGGGHRRQRPRPLDRPDQRAPQRRPNIEVRDGSFFAPVAGETFDLIATNPPFVISPATGERLVYRDSGLPGDRVVEDIVRAAPGHLTPGGWCQVLANWVVERGRPWDERLAGWLDGCDAWTVQREVVDPATYVEMWLKDAGMQGGADYVRRYDTWLAWFEEQRIEAVGFGWINLRRTGVERPEVRFEEWPYDVEQPIAPTIADWGRAVDDLRSLDDDALAARHLVVRADVRQETVGEPGAEDPEHIVLRQQRGLRRARTADTVEAALVGACDGDLSVDAILGALGGLLELDAAEARTTYLPVVRELVAEGFLELG